MATALIDVTIDGLSNEEVDLVADKVKELLVKEFPTVDADLNPDSEYDDLDEDVE